MTVYKTEEGTVGDQAKERMHDPGTEDARPRGIDSWGGIES